MDMREPNRPLYYTIAILVLVATSLGSIMWVSSRGNTDNEQVIVAAILAFVGPAVTSMLALLAGMNAASNSANVDRKVQDVQKTVNGTLTNLAAQNERLSTAVAKSPDAAKHFEELETQSKGYSE